MWSNAGVTSIQPIHGPVVLAVDDDPWVRFRLEGFLLDAQAPFEMCSDPFDALERCKARPSYYGLVFMDIRFPGGDLGFEVSKQISVLGDLTQRPAIVGMSGYPDLYRFNGGGEWGMVDILPKPLFKWLVFNMIREYCGMELSETES